MATSRAFLFDVFGTLVDWRGSITRELANTLGAKGIDADPHALAVAWRDEYDPSMAKIRGGRRAYVNLDVLHRENLDRILLRAGIEELDEAARADLTRAWERLDPWSDSVPGLEAFRAIGLVAPCSNGSIRLMAHLARYAGFHWDAILGAEISRTYKPDPETYLKSCAALQLPPDQVMMVAAHNADLAAAHAVGLRTGFVPRRHEHADPERHELAPTGDWDAVGRDLVDLARRIVDDGAQGSPVAGLVLPEFG